MNFFLESTYISTGQGVSGDSTNGDADDINPDDDFELENPSQEQAPPPSGGSSDPIFD